MRMGSNPMADVFTKRGEERQRDTMGRPGEDRGRD